MQYAKTFFITFLTSVLIVFICFVALYWIITPSQQYTGTQQDNIPMANAGSQDNKTTLFSLQDDNIHMFFIIKLNAVDKEISVTAVPSDYYISHSNRTLQDSYNYAGIMQCVEDLSRQLDIVTDYHLVLDSKTYSLLSDKLTAENSFPLFASLSPSEAAVYITEFIRNNISEIQAMLLPQIPAELSYMHTNIGKPETARIDRILTLLQRSEISYICNSLAAHTDIAIAQ